MLYIGIDPGSNGGLAAIRPDIGQVITHKIPESERELAQWLRVVGCRNDIGVRVVMEQQIPRPTFFFNKFSNQPQNSILKSTCILYGGYMGLRGMLIALDLHFDVVPPQVWQRYMGLPVRPKKISDNKWKNTLKALAQKLFPDTKVTLWSSDALLLAEYAHRVFGSVPPPLKTFTVKRILTPKRTIDVV